MDVRQVDTAPYSLLKGLKKLKKQAAAIACVPACAINPPDEDHLHGGFIKHELLMDPYLAEAAAKLFNIDVVQFGSVYDAEWLETFGGPPTMIYGYVTGGGSVGCDVTAINWGPTTSVVGKSAIVADNSVIFSSGCRSFQRGVDTRLDGPLEIDLGYENAFEFGEGMKMWDGNFIQSVRCGHVNFTVRSLAGWQRRTSAVYSKFWDDLSDCHRCLDASLSG